MISLSVSRMMWKTATIQRPPASIDGKRGSPTIIHVNVPCTPLDPIDTELHLRPSIETPHELLQGYIAGDYDIEIGDVLIMNNVEYPIRYVGEWESDQRGDMRRVIVEDLKV